MTHSEMLDTGQGVAYGGVGWQILNTGNVVPPPNPHIYYSKHQGVFLGRVVQLLSAQEAHSEPMAPRDSSQPKFSPG